MNAGVIGPQSMELTANGVTTVFATNVLGHVVLLEGLGGDDEADAELRRTAASVAQQLKRRAPKK